MRLILVALILAGCGGSSSLDAGHDAGGHDAAGDASCVMPVQGASCTLNEIACQPSGPCADYNWTCNENSGTWQTYGLGHAPCADAGAGADGPSVDGGPTCVPHNGTYTCLGGSWPVCPSTANTNAPCTIGPQGCMGCSEGAGFTCSCSDAGGPQFDGGPDPYWVCVGTEYTCE